MAISIVTAGGAIVSLATTGVSGVQYSNSIVPWLPAVSVFSGSYSYQDPSASSPTYIVSSTIPVPAVLSGELVIDVTNWGHTGTSSGQWSEIYFEMDYSIDGSVWIQNATSFTAVAGQTGGSTADPVPNISTTSVSVMPYFRIRMYALVGDDGNFNTDQFTLNVKYQIGAEL